MLPVSGMQLTDNDSIKSVCAFLKATLGTDTNTASLKPNTVKGYVSRVGSALRLLQQKLPRFKTLQHFDQLKGETIAILKQHYTSPSYRIAVFVAIIKIMKVLKVKGVQEYKNELDALIKKRDKNKKTLVYRQR